MERRVKICGLFRIQDIQAVNVYKPDYAGFVIDFPKSHRNVSIKWLKALRSMLDPDIKAVGVLVDKPVELVAELLNSGIIDIAQLHGSEDNEYIERLRELITSDSEEADGEERVSRIWQAVQVKTEADVEAANASAADFVLTDAGQGKGKAFNWELLEKISRPFGLAGGLSAANAEDAKQTAAELFDVSGGVETEKLKDAKKVEEFIRLIREAE